MCFIHNITNATSYHHIGLMLSILFYTNEVPFAFLRHGLIIIFNLTWGSKEETYLHYAKHDALYRKVQTGQNNLRKKERKKELKKFSTLKKEGERENVLTLSSPGKGREWGKARPTGVSKGGRRRQRQQKEYHRQSARDLRGRRTYFFSPFRSRVFRRNKFRRKRIYLL